MKKTHHWRTHLLAREAVKNVFSLRARLFPYALSALLLGSLSAIALTAQWAGFASSIDDMRLQGRGVFIAGASSEKNPISIERSSCEDLSDLPTVVRAGFVVNLGRQQILPLGGGIPTLAVSPSLLPQLRDHQALVGSALSKDGFSGHLAMSGVTVAAAQGKVAPAGVDVNSAVSVPLPATITANSQCVIEMDWRATPRDVSTAISSLTVNGGNVAAVAAYRESPSAVAAFIERPERWLPVLLGVIGGLATSLAVRSRRGELAAYLYGGASPRALAKLITFECTLIGGLAATSGGVTMVALSPFAISPSAGALGALATGAIWVSASLPLAMQTAMVSPVDLGKGR